MDSLAETGGRALTETAAQGPVLPVQLHHGHTGQAGAQWDQGDDQPAGLAGQLEVLPLPPHLLSPAQPQLLAPLLPQV